MGKNAFSGKKTLDIGNTTCYDKKYLLKKKKQKGGGLQIIA
jgi:hypothetical protein